MEGSKPQIDVYDEEFYNNLQLAKKMVTEIRNRRGNVKYVHIVSKDL